MYSLDQRIKAVELYIKNHLSAAATIRELGYPNRHTLKEWYLEYQNNNCKLKDGLVRKSKFSEKQRQAALQYYLDHGRNVKRTVQKKGYKVSGTIGVTNNSRRKTTMILNDTL